jgi:hypothetical protein
MSDALQNFSASALHESARGTSLFTLVDLQRRSSEAFNISARKCTSAKNNKKNHLSILNWRTSSRQSLVVLRPVTDPFSSSSIWFDRQVAKRPSPGLIVLQKYLTSALHVFVVSTSPSPLQYKTNVVGKAL